jgi:hypothetical protein
MLDPQNIPDFTGLDIAFGAKLEHFCDPIQGSAWQDAFHKEASAARSLFFKGGKLAQYGYRFRAGVDKGKAFRAIQALLCSFEPSQEAKIGTVAKLLHEWCEECEPEEAVKPSTAKKAVARASKKWRKKR